MNETRFPKDVDLIPHGVEAAKQFAGEWAAAAAGVPGDPQHVLRVNSWKQGWGDLKANRAVFGDGPLTIAGQMFASGLGTHTESEIILRANQPVRALRAWVGMNDSFWCRVAAPNKG